MTEETILDSWNQNASLWELLVDDNQIESRVVATNNAIIEVIAAKSWSKVLDVGCGEGWLVRELAHRGIESYGVDGSHKLIELAREKSGELFQCLSYDEIIARKEILNAPFDGIVINFALFDKERPRWLLTKLSSYLRAENSSILIQTLPPRDMHKMSGWNSNAWDGLPGSFSNPYAWYHHSEDEWLAIFEDANLNLTHQRSVFHPASKKHLSTIFGLEAQK